MSLPGLDVRPTPDRLREALFNVLAPQIQGVLFVDAYAGTGSVGIEALSRGARHVLFLERSRSATAVIRENLRSLGALQRATVSLGRVDKLLAAVRGADIVFLDPPYPREDEYELAMSALAHHPPGLVIVQHASRFALDDLYGDLVKYRDLRQGDNTLSFYRPVKNSPS